MNADKDADGVVAAAAAIVVDDALYIYCQHLVCFFSCRYARAWGFVHIVVVFFASFLADTHQGLSVMVVIGRRRRR